MANRAVVSVVSLIPPTSAAAPSTNEFSGGNDRHTLMTSPQRVSQPLREAAQAGDVAAVNSLLAAGLDVNAANNWGETALHVATFSDRTEVVNILIANGADPELKSMVGLTALDLAERRERNGPAAILRRALRRIREQRELEG